MKKQLLIVDGYNMIGAWPELAVLKKQDRLEEAREDLLNRLSNYAKYEGIQIMVVFDAQLVPGITQSYEKYQLEVIFTQEGETADSYIERTAGQLNNLLTQVTVATSDLAEQWVIFSEIHYQDYRRNSPWNEDQLAQLAQKLAELSEQTKKK